MVIQADKRNRRAAFAGALALMIGLLAHDIEARAAGDHGWRCSDIDPSRQHRYQRHIDQAGRRHGLDTALIAAVIQAESAFNPQARSRAGARGLMQLMPRTARELQIRDVYDPMQNVDGGTRYLKQQILRFGDVSKGLWAYNAGPQRVEARKLFEETRNYIPRVIFYYWCLKQGGQQP